MSSRRGVLTRRDRAEQKRRAVEFVPDDASSTIDYARATAAHFEYESSAATATTTTTHHADATQSSDEQDDDDDDDVSWSTARAHVSVVGSVSSVGNSERVRRQMYAQTPTTPFSTLVRAAARTAKSGVYETPSNDLKRKAGNYDDDSNDVHYRRDSFDAKDGETGLEFPQRHHQFDRQSPEDLQKRFRPPTAPRLNRRTIDAVVRTAREQLHDKIEFRTNPLVVFAHLVAGHADKPVSTLLRTERLIDRPPLVIGGSRDAPQLYDANSPVVNVVAAATTTTGGDDNASALNDDDDDDDGSLTARQQAPQQMRRRGGVNATRARTADQWLNRTEVMGEVWYEPVYQAKLSEAFRTLQIEYPGVFDDGAARTTTLLPRRRRASLEDLQVSTDMRDAFARLVAVLIRYTGFVYGRGASRYVSDRRLYTNMRHNALRELGGAMFNYAARAPNERVVFSRALYERRLRNGDDGVGSRMSEWSGWSGGGVSDGEVALVL